jgi:hypothetical protein
VTARSLLTLIQARRFPILRVVDHASADLRKSIKFSLVLVGALRYRATSYAAVLAALPAATRVRLFSIQAGPVRTSGSCRSRLTDSTREPRAPRALPLSGDRSPSCAEAQGTNGPPTFEKVSKPSGAGYDDNGRCKALGIFGFHKGSRRD